MRNTLGNYREKMAVDEQKHGKAACSIKFTPLSSQNKKYLFLKKAASTGKEKGEEEKHSNIVTCSLNSGEKMMYKMYLNLIFTLRNKTIFCKYKNGCFYYN